MTGASMTLDPQPAVAEPQPALLVDDLSLAYVVRGIARPVLRGVSFHVKPGESYGLVGESGCGKSTTAYAAVRYLPRNARITGGRILVDGDDITKMSADEIRRYRIHHASMVYQDPGAALNPTTKVGQQVAEAFGILGQSGEQARESALAAMRRVQIADPERVYQRYPYQLSGGMQQRIVIAIALASDPKLLILDEPTTGLDATVEASVLDLVRSLRAEMNAAVLLIAHNLGVIRAMCDRVGVMYAGKIVEEGIASQVFERPQHPYTLGLLRSLPRHGIRKAQRPAGHHPGHAPADRDAPSDVRLRGSLPLGRRAMSDRGAAERRAGRWAHDAVPPLRTDRADRRASAGRRPRDRHWRAGARRERGVQDVPPQRSRRARDRRGRSRGLSRRDPRAGRRVGLGQVDPGAHHPRHRGAGCRRPDRARRHLLGATAADRPAEDKRSIQMVFQNPDSALNRGWSVATSCGGP